MECGWPGISRNECEQKNCCFNNTIPNVKWCFFPPGNVQASKPVTCFILIRLSCFYEDVSKLLFVTRILGSNLHINDGKKFIINSIVCSKLIN